MGDNIYFLKGIARKKKILASDYARIKRAKCSFGGDGGSKADGKRNESHIYQQTGNKKRVQSPRETSFKRGDTVGLGNDYTDEKKFLRREKKTIAGPVIIVGGSSRSGYKKETFCRTNSVPTLLQGRCDPCQSLHDSRLVEDGNGINECVLTKTMA